WIAVDNFAGSGQGNVYLVGTSSIASVGIRLYRSTDQGDTFGPTGGVPIVTGIDVSRALGGYVAVGPDHAVYVFWLDSRQITPRILMRKSSDQGTTFGPETVVTAVTTNGSVGDLGLTGRRNGLTTSSNFGSNTYPQVAVNPVSGHLYVVYNDNPPGADK